jgi:uncharacterized lipoprotein YehR (DUF1307 family)
MKKFVAISVSIIMVFSVLALTACGGGGSSEDLSDSKYVGTWKGVEMTVADESEEFQDDIILTINGDGTGTLVGSEEGETEESSFTWEPTSDGFKTKGDVKMTFKDDGDKITSKIIGVTMVFEKQ